MEILNDFLEKLSRRKKIDSDYYIDCCLVSIKEWDNPEYWHRINCKCKEILKMDIDDLCRCKYRIRNSTEKTNSIYKSIYNNGEVIGNDDHNISLYELTKGCSFADSKRYINNSKNIDPFKDYRISHVWGCTKNIYLNNLPFNYFAIPSFCYCLSDKNNGGNIGRNFRIELRKKIIKKCDSSIIEYNKRMIACASKFKDNLNKCLDGYNESYLSQRIKYILEQFILIPVNPNNKFLEDGLCVYEFKNGKVVYTEQYIEIRKNNFKDYV